MSDVFSRREIITIEAMGNALAHHAGGRTVYSRDNQVSCYYKGSVEHYKGFVLDSRQGEVCLMSDTDDWDICVLTQQLLWVTSSKVQGYSALCENGY